MLVDDDEAEAEQQALEVLEISRAQWETRALARVEAKRKKQVYEEMKLVMTGKNAAGEGT